MSGSPTDAASPPIVERLHLCRAGWSETLAAELQRVFPEAPHSVLGPSLVMSGLARHDAARTPSLAFARQTLPAAAPAKCPSITRWAAAGCDAILKSLCDHTGSLRVHVFNAPETESDETTPRRCKLIRNELLTNLKERRRKVWRNVTGDDVSDWSADEAILQVVLRSPTEGWISVCLADERQRLRRCLSRFTAGAVTVEEDKAAPSSAHKKLREVELRLARPIRAGETCVDLGGSPGGWSWVALERGANVIALDRSPLRKDLMSNPRVTFSKADAFAHDPSRPVDWLLCDVIAFPQRTLKLLDRWLTHGWCRQFCVTIKFRGREDDAVLEEFKAMLFRHEAEFTLRQLDSNRNEVTAYGLAKTV